MPPPAGPPHGFVSGHLPPPSGPPPSMSMHRLPPPMMPPPGYAVLMPPPPGDVSHDLSAIACLSPCCHLCLAPFCRAGHVCCTTFLKSVYVSNAAIETVMPVCACVGFGGVLAPVKVQSWLTLWLHLLEAWCNKTILCQLQQYMT